MGGGWRDQNRFLCPEGLLTNGVITELVTRVRASRSGGHLQDYFAALCKSARMATDERTVFCFAILSVNVDSISVCKHAITAECD